MNEIDQQKSALPGFPGYMAAMNYLEDLKDESDSKRRVKEIGLAKFSQLPHARKREAEARYEILTAQNAFIKASGLKKGEGMNLFRTLYNQGKINLPDWVFEAAGRDSKLDRSTLFRWEKAYREQGLFGLASSYGHRKGVTRLTDEQKVFIKALIADHPDVLIPKIMAALEARFIPQGVAVPASHVVNHFVKGYRRENQSLLLFMKNPDAWKQKCQFAPGSASANIIRLNQLWETDATPADIMLVDGRHTAIGIIDVLSRRAKILITPTSKAQAVATLLRRCMIAWGVPEVLCSDNGKDFTARHMERILDALEIEHVLCPPFTPEAKPHIERFFHTFSHGIVELLPGFIGHDVAERKAIEARRSFADRMMKRGEIVEVKLTAREFQTICDRWINAIYMQDIHGGLDGKSPAAMVRASENRVRKITDERALDILLCPAPKDGGLRVVGKKGIEVDRRYYFNTAMAGYELQRVRVLVDHSDLGRVYCFEESGAFLCIATCPSWDGISAAEEAGCLKRRQKENIVEQRRELKALAKEAKINLVPEEVISYRESLIENVAEIPRESTPYTTPALEEAAIAAADRDGGGKNAAALAGPLELSPEVIAHEEEQKRVVNFQEKRRKRRLIATDWEAYTWILDNIKAGTSTGNQRQWKKEYEVDLESGSKKPFSGSVSIAELLEEVVGMREAK